MPGIIMDDAVLPQNEHQRLPGLFRRWELAQLLEPGRDYRLEDAGSTTDGSPLFAVYERASGAPGVAP